MWSTWSEKATASLTQALEKTGDALSKAATTAGKQAREKQPGGEEEQQEEGTIAELPPKEGEEEASAAGTEGGGDAAEQTGSSTSSRKGTGTGTAAASVWGSAAASSLTHALEKTGDVLSKAATNAGKSARSSLDKEAAVLVATGGDGDGSGGEEEEGEDHHQQQQNKDLLKNLQMGWSSVVETTKASIKVAQEKIEEEQTKLSSKLKRAKADLYKRDVSMPLDVEALKDAEVVYLTDRLITLSHPAMASALHPDIITGERKLAAVQHLLQCRHEGRYMVWNLSEVEYDIDILDDQVLTFSFPGSPSPPLGLLLKLLVSMESWLKADERNVAVVHCLTGKGRTSTVLAAFLCWMGEAGFSDIYDALAYIAQCKQLTVDELTIPSQRRYTSYFKNMLDSVRPSQPPLMLKRIILSEAPRYAKGPPLSEEQRAKMAKEKEKYGDDELRMGCAPYLQVFKAGRLLKTAPGSLGYAQNSPDELPFCQVADGTISFHVDQMVQGDILLRCRHLTPKRQRVSMFRAALHTGYIPPKVMRLTKGQLDGACHDDRFSDDFFMDLIFEPVASQEAGQALLDEESETSTASSPSHHIEGGATYRASQYDSMLHRDSRFWEVIAQRKQAHEQQQHQQEAAEGDEGADDKVKNDPNWGPTVGRRRVFDKTKKGGTAPGGGKDSAGGASDAASATGGGGGGAAAAAAKKSALETFSIGGEFDFLPETIEPEHAASPAVVPKAKASAVPPKAKAKKRDTLMEALMGALDEEVDEDDDNADGGDEEDDELGTEEIVFGDADDEAEVAAPEPTIVALPPKESAEAKASTAADADTTPPASAPEAADTTTTTTTETVATAATDEPKTAPAKQTSTATDSSSQDMHEMEELLADADLEGVDDVDMDAVPEAEDDDGADLDLDDAELEDLENFLGANK